MIHSFNVEIAREYGIPSAIILQQLIICIEDNMDEGTHKMNGRTWACQSAKELSEKMPYFSEDAIQRAIAKMIKSGLITKGKPESETMDRSSWYTVTDKTNHLVIQSPIARIRGMQDAESRNASRENAECIPQKREIGETLTGQGIEATSTETEVAKNATDQDTPYIYNIFLDNKDIVSDKHTDNYTDNQSNNNLKSNNVGKPDTSAATRREIIDYLNSKTGARYRDSALAKKHIVARLNEGYTVEDFKKVIDYKCNEWLGTDMAKYLRPETLFGTKMDGYLGAASVKQTYVGANGIKIDSALAEDEELTAIFG